MKNSFLLLIILSIFLLPSLAFSNEGICIEGDCINGKGILTYPDGPQYVGLWKGGKLNGNGFVIFPDGYKFVGKWKDGELIGDGILTSPDGSKYVGQWANKGNAVKESYPKRYALTIVLVLGLIFCLVYFVKKIHLNFKSKSLHKGTLLCIISTILLFIGFFSNGWKIVDQKWFDGHQYDSENLVLERISQSNKEGIFSYGGLLGFWSNTDGYIPYNSQVGGQGMLFSMLDRIIPGPTFKKLSIHHAFTSILSAFVISLIIVWFWREFGLWAGLFVLISTVFSPWLVVFGKNLYWVIWAYYLPMLLVMNYLKYYRLSCSWSPKRLGIIFFIGIFIKCFFSGMEFITSTFIMMLVPFVYYSAHDKLKLSKLLKGSIAITASSIISILLTLSILSFQIASTQGSISKGIDHIVSTYHRRTHGGGDQPIPPVLKGSVEAKTTAVVDTYLNGTFLDTSIFIFSSNSFIYRLIHKFNYKFSYLHLIYLFFIPSLYLSLRKYLFVSKKESQSDFPLVLATWFSILAPLSWFVLFKGHSYIHTHMNYVVWHMPFALFGFGLCGLCIKRAFLDLISLKSFISDDH